MKINRILIERDPFLPPYPDGGLVISRWRAHWITNPALEQGAAVCAFRRRFTLDRPLSVRLHVSADERYELFVNGVRVGRGPERGDPANWFFETYECTFEAGEHCVVAIVWAGGAHKPAAQMSVTPGFLCASEDTAYDNMFTTGVAHWETLHVQGIRLLPQKHVFSSGGGTEIEGTLFPWGVEYGAGDGWSTVKLGLRARSAGSTGSWGEYGQEHMLRPATLVPQREGLFPGPRVRFVAPVGSSETTPIAVDSRDDTQSLHSSWQLLFDTGGKVTVPANSKIRVIAEFDTYVCCYDEIVVSGGREAIVRVTYTEALYEEARCDQHSPKGKRDSIEGKYFKGESNVYRTDGGGGRRFVPLWWRAGRYVEVFVETKREPLILEAVRFYETRYPFEPEAHCELSDQRLAAIWPLCIRTMQMNMHETFLDGPFYEQMQYALEARMLALVSYPLTRDNRLARKAIELFAASRMPSGLTRSSYPSCGFQSIPTLSLLWCTMVYEYALWRGDKVLVESVMPVVRGVLDVFWRCRTGAGYLEYPPGWNFIDHTGAEGWRMGVPPGWSDNTSAELNWQFVMTAAQVARVEEWLGEEELAARMRRMACSVAHVCERVFWCDRRGCFASDLSGRYFSEQAQSLALLSGVLNPAIFQRLSQTLASPEGLVQATLYFKHFLFEAYRLIGRPDLIVQRMDEWSEALEQGFKTVRENPEPTRGDCQGWGVHPVFHFVASLAGIRPADFAFSSVEVWPQLGPLSKISGSVVHPAGEIAFDFHQRNGSVHGYVRLPPGVRGVLVRRGTRSELCPELNEF